MSTLVFFLEEPSARAMLEAFLPVFLPADVQVRYRVFEGKQDLHKRLGKRLREWQQPDTYFLILQDQDSNDCQALKQTLQQICQESGQNKTRVRIACHSLESWCLGDLSAVEQGLKLNGLSCRQREKKFRNPDALNNPDEELHKLTRGVYQKKAGSSAIGAFLSTQNNQSHSFHVFLSGLRQLIGSSR
jgi:hypothetical protein